MARGEGGKGELFRVGYRHCFTVDENLICTVRREEAEEQEGEGEEEKRHSRSLDKERERERGAEGRGGGGRSDGCCLV